MERRARGGVFLLGKKGIRIVVWKSSTKGLEMPFRRKQEASSLKTLLDPGFRRCE